MSIIINNKKIVGTEPSVGSGDLGLFAGSDDKFYVKKSDGTSYPLWFTGGGGGSSSVISITYSALMSLANSDSLDLSVIYKITNVGNTFSLCIDPNPVVNTGRGNVYVRPASTSIIDPNGVWEAEFKYTAKWVLNLSKYDFDRLWTGQTMNSLVVTPEDVPDGHPIITSTELLSSSVSFGSDLETFAINLESSINGNSISSGWEVYGWTISGLPFITDYDVVDINTTTKPLSATFSLLSMIIETSNPTSSYFGNFIVSDYGSGYTFPPYGILGTPSIKADSAPFYSIQNGLDPGTYSLSCIYDPITNDIMEVRDAAGNVWRGSLELSGIGVSSIYDYPIYCPGYFFTAFLNCNIESCYINEYNFIGNQALNSNFKGLWLGVDANFGPSITNSYIVGNIQNFLAEGLPSKIMDCSITSKNNFNLNSTYICDTNIQDNLTAVYSVIMSSDIQLDSNSHQNIYQMILRDNIMTSKGDVLRSSPNFKNADYGKTFSLFKSLEGGFWQFGYQTPLTASASSDIVMSTYLINEQGGFTSSLLFTSSMSLLSQTYSSVDVMLENDGSYWGLLVSFDTDVSVDKLNFGNGSRLSNFNIFAKKL